MASIHPSRLGLVDHANRGSSHHDGPTASSPEHQEAELKARLLNRRTDAGALAAGESGRHPRESDNRYNRTDRGYPPRSSHDYSRPPPPRRSSPDYSQRPSHYDDRYRVPPPPRDGNRGYTPPQHPGPPPEAPPNGWGRVEGGRPGGGGPPAGQGDFFAARDAQRKASTLTVWPDSPTRPLEEEEEEAQRSKARAKGKSKSSRDKDRKRHRGYDDDRSDRKRHRDDDKHRSHHRSSRSHRDRDRKDRHRRSKRSRYSSDSDSASNSDMGSRSRRRRHSPRSASPADRQRSTSAKPPMALAKAPADEPRETEEVADEVDVIGPSLPVTEDGQKIDPRAYGGALLAGEGAAMAAYVAEGARIPRRGEIGLDSEQIEKYEQAGFVMSGSRHQRMNAVRMRKENQVISAEEQRSILKMRREEKEKREREIVGQFRDLVDNFKPAR